MIKFKSKTNVILKDTYAGSIVGVKPLFNVSKDDAIGWLDIGNDVSQGLGAAI
jgi:hypothetical protein